MTALLTSAARAPASFTVAAIEFAMAVDDGLNPQHWLRADMVLEDLAGAPGGAQCHLGHLGGGGTVERPRRSAARGR